LEASKKKPSRWLFSGTVFIFQIPTIIINMTAEEYFLQIKDQVVGKRCIITSVDEAERFHKLFIQVRSKFYQNTQLEIMPHYRGEQNYGWDIQSGIFRPPLNITDPALAKQLEQQDIVEFENVITNKIGRHVLRDVFNKEKHGKDWDLLFQAQHAGIKTTLTDWSAEIITALYFATEESKNLNIENADGQLWAFLIPIPLIIGHNNRPVRRTFYDMNPFAMQQTYLINVSSYLDNIQDRIFEYRMFRQKGRFVMSANRYCHIPLNKQEYMNQFIFRLQIPHEYKKSIRTELAARGVIRENMYIDETSAHQQLITDINDKIFKSYMLDVPNAIATKIISV
jgi:hypothetical protein